MANQRIRSFKKIGIIALNEYPLREQQQYYRMCIPYIYAHWEGFVVESFKLLITYLNNEQLDKKKNVINELYTFSLQKVLKPLLENKVLNNHTNLLKKFVKEFDKELYIEPSLLTANSNLNYKQMTIILSKFGMNNCVEKIQIRYKSVSE